MPSRVRVWLALQGLLVSLGPVGCVLDNPFTFDPDLLPPEAGSTFDNSTTEELDEAGISEAGPFDGVPDAETEAGTDGGSDAGGDAGDAGNEPCEEDTDCPDPGACRFAVCREQTGACIIDNEPSGEPCEVDGGLRCHEGDCLTCRLDGEHNDEETDVDCGGPYCEGCEADGACEQDSDCRSLICLKESDAATSGTCDDYSCIDGLKNGDEGGPDCGGSCDERCALGVSCEQNDDCSTGHCVDGICCGSPCQGVCRSCQAGSGICRLAADGTDPRDDCGSSSCNGGGACAQCTDGEQNGAETDVDCGGDCRPCGDGLACSRSTDCESCLCEERLCVAPRCDNGIIDGCETDTDCGGPCGPFCGLGQLCEQKSDCFESLACQDDGSTLMCVAP